MTLGRREFVIAGAALVASAPFTSIPIARAASPSRLQLAGSMKQGGLVVGTGTGATHVMVDGKEINLSPFGVFAFGLAYDQTAPAHLAVKYSDGGTQERDVTPEVRQYDVQSVSGLPPNLVEPSPEDLKRIEREHALVAEARETNSDETWYAEPFEWPAAGIVSGVFGSQRILNGTPGRPHFGVDIAAGAGATIFAPAKARVLLARNFLLEGGFTLLDHGHGVFTGYMHQSKLGVKEGATVEQGEEMGLVGATGRATGPHLHWSMNWFQVRLDPALSTRLPAPDKA